MGPNAIGLASLEEETPGTCRHQGKATRHTARAKESPARNQP